MRDRYSPRIRVRVRVRVRLVASLGALAYFSIYCTAVPDIVVKEKSVEGRDRTMYYVITRRPMWSGRSLLCCAMARDCLMGDTYLTLDSSE